MGGATRWRRAVGWVSLVALLTATVAFPGDSAEAGVLPPGGTFLDDDGNIHEGMIEAIAAEGITLGCDVVGPLYCPKAEVPRDQMASFLARALELPDSATNWFDDDDGNTHEANINKVADAGITLGIGSRLYDPKGLVSRAQMASFLARAMMLPDSTTNWFTDDEGNTHEANINKVADDGITLGCDSAGNYCPLDNVKRDQMASFLGRALGLEEMIPPPPPPGPVTIELTDFIFTPMDLTVASGTEVMFDNVVGFHSLIWVSGPYPALDPAANAPWDVTFTANTAGTFGYFCNVHGTATTGMFGTLTVDP